MNCYVGLAKRIVKSFFPREIPVPQLEPLDARKIFYASSDEEVWKATLVWAEAKAQEREAAALKAVSETNTDESYDSDDSEVGVPIQPVLKKGKLGNLNFKFPGAAPAPSASQTDKCPYPDSDEDEGDGDYGTDDDDFGDFKAPASKPSKTGCPALGDGRRRLFLCN